MSKMMKMMFLVVFFITAVQIDAMHNEPDFYQYLQQFGYTPKVEGRRLFSVLAKSSYREGILKLQRLYKLPETGELDDRTRSLMQKARCGNPDLGTYESIRQPMNIDVPQGFFRVQGRSGKSSNTPENSVPPTTIWPKKNLKWFIETYPERQKLLGSPEEVRRILAQAFDDWQKYSGLKFEMARSKSDADLKVRFHAKDHGDGYPFDGPGTTLAHAFYPKSGDIHFDDDEQFTNKYKNDHEQYTLRLVAAHEIGHALGLSHSFEAESLMYPVYQQFNESYTLSSDDQQGIQTLYGKPEIIPQIKSTLVPSISTPTPPSTPIPIDNWCSGEFQTACEGPDGELYLFKDEQVWRFQVKNKRGWDAQPILINERFPSMPDTTITACVKSSMGYTYLFRNYRMWRMKTHWAVEGPHVLYGKHYPQNPRLALLHQNSVYLIRNRLIYRLNEADYEQEFEIRTIDSILNPPPTEFIRSGFTYAQRHYIFTKDLVYVYDATNGNLLHGYPKARTNGWFACESAAHIPKWRKKMTSTANPFTRKSQDNDGDEEEFEPFHHHHHHHHHHHRPRRPVFPQHRPPPHDYRRRWED